MNLGGRGREYLDQESDCKYLKMGSAPWCSLNQEGIHQEKADRYGDCRVAIITDIIYY
jgi:hypothetical protein